MAVEKKLLWGGIEITHLFNVYSLLFAMALLGTGFT
jgi:hypothetical protein